MSSLIGAIVSLATSLLDTQSGVPRSGSGAIGLLAIGDVETDQDADSEGGDIDSLTKGLEGVEVLGGDFR